MTPTQLIGQLQGALMLCCTELEEFRPENRDTLDCADRALQQSAEYLKQVGADDAL